MPIKVLELHHHGIRIGTNDEDVENQLLEAWDKADRTIKASFARKDILNTVQRFLLESGAKQYFGRKGKRIALTEREFSNKNGELFRCDRVVFEDELITVMDYKTGGEEKESEYKTQIKNYMEILQEIYSDKKVQGCIAYVDVKKTVHVT